MIITIFNILKAQKLHIIYGIIIVTVSAFAYNLFVRKPAVITQTKTVVKTVTQYVEKKVLVHDNIVTNKKIETKKPDGTVITEEDDTTDLSDTASDTSKKVVADTSISEKTVTSFLSKYTLTALYPIPRSQILAPQFDPKNMQLILGYRVFQTPILLNVGTTFGVNTLFIGITLEL